jgi:hypothetical protein
VKTIVDAFANLSDVQLRKIVESKAHYFVTVFGAGGEPHIFFDGPEDFRVDVRKVYEAVKARNGKM